MAKGRKTGGRDWKPGESGNLKGRPLNPLNQAIQKELSKRHYITIDGQRKILSENEILINVLRQFAREGNLRAIELLWDRGYGKPDQNIGLSGDPIIQIVPPEK